MIVRVTTVPADPRQTRHRLLLQFGAARPTLLAELTGLVGIESWLTLRAGYHPPETEYSADHWTIELHRRAPDATGATFLDTIYGDLPLCLPPTQWGKPITPEAVAAHSHRIAGTAMLRVIGVHVDPPHRALHGDAQNGVALVECYGLGWAPFKAPRRRELPAGTHLVYADGEILGRAARDGGATALAKQKHKRVPEHGWRLSDTPAGRFWIARPADDVAHRLRRFRSACVDLVGLARALTTIDLAREPELAREALESLAELQQRAAEMAAVAGVPMPRATKRDPADRRAA